MARIVTSFIALLFLVLCAVFCADAIMGYELVSSTVGADFLGDMIGLEIVVASALVGTALTLTSLFMKGPKWVAAVDLAFLGLFIAAVVLTYLAISGLLPFAVSK